MVIRIAGWHVEGFGVLHDYDVADIPAGLTVFTGPNEAGKSTLLAFIRTMLFGFPGGNDGVTVYPALRGGRHGGQLSLVDTDDATYVIDRQSGRRPPVITRAGQPASTTDLDRMLGGCDRQLFQSIFAFDLADLQELEGLDHAEVRERLALVGIAGSGASPARAITQLEERRALATLASGGTGIDDLKRQVDDTSRSLALARERDAQSVAARDRERNAASLLEIKTSEINDLVREGDQRQLLLQAWPHWSEKLQAETQRGQLDLDDTVHALASDIDDVAKLITEFQTAQAALPILEQTQIEAEDALQARLRDLGPEWDRARLRFASDAAPPPPVIETYARDLTAAEASLQEATRTVIAARAEVAGVVRATAEKEAKRSALAAVIGDRGIDERHTALRRLRARRSDLTSAEVQLQLERTTLEGLDELRLQSERSMVFVPPGWLVGVALAILVAAAIGAVFLFTNGDVLTGLVVAAAALGSLVLGLVIRSQTDRADRERTRQQNDIISRIADGRTTLEQQRQRVATLREDIAANAATLGLSPLPSHTDIEEAERRLIEAEEANHALDQQQVEIERTTVQAEAVAARANEAAAAQKDAETARDHVVDAWARWRAKSRLPEALDPSGAMAFLTLVTDGRQKALELDSREADLARSRELIETVGEKLAQLSAALDVPLAEEPSELTAGLDRLQDRVNRDREARQVAASLEQQSIAAAERITSILGDDIQLREHLSRGNTSGWETDLVEISSQIGTLEQERLALARTSGEAQIERQAIENSDDIPTFNLRLAMLETELSTALREQRVTSLAETLIRETVQRIEQERQPDVLRRASTLFTRITDGRYQRVFHPVEVAGLEIEDASGGTRPPEALSRGTLEQLYVALRLGLAEAFTENVGALPLIMDDVLVNFDPERARGVAQALFDVSSGRQVLIFTSQPGTVELLAGIGDQFGHFAMERHGTGGEWVKHP